MAKTWILTGSLDNFRATREHGFRVIGAKEGRRGMAEQIEPGDRIVFYVTGVQAFGGIVGVTGEMYEDREQIWPGKPGKARRVPVALRDRAGDRARRGRASCPRSSWSGELEHARKWPAEHWHLAFQGQLRTVSEADAELLERRIRAAPARRRDPRAPLHPRGGGGGAAAGGRADRADARGALAPDRRRGARGALGGQPDQRRRRAGRTVSEGFLELRESLVGLRELGVVLRDLERGLVDFPSLRDGREVYLCWQEGEDEIAFWHEVDAGFAGRRPLDDG